MELFLFSWYSIAREVALLYISIENLFQGEKKKVISARNPIPFLFFLIRLQLGRISSLIYLSCCPSLLETSGDL